MPELDITEEYLRFRQENPNKYTRFRTSESWEDEEGTLKAIYGIYQTNGGLKSEVQSLLFKKDEWSVDEAKDWIEGHEEFHHSSPRIYSSVTVLR